MPYIENDIGMEAHKSPSVFKCVRPAADAHLPQLRIRHSSESDTAPVLTLLTLRARGANVAASISETTSQAALWRKR